jgi:hypothetical protein
LFQPASQRVGVHAELLRDPRGRTIGGVGVLLCFSNEAHCALSKLSGVLLGHEK